MKVAINIGILILGAIVGAAVVYFLVLADSDDRDGRKVEAEAVDYEKIYAELRKDKQIAEEKDWFADKIEESEAEASDRLKKLEGEGDGAQSEFDKFKQ